jgi:hypothetical protein
MNLFGFLKRKPKVEPQKQLPASTGPVLIECGLCNEKLEAKMLYEHWQMHTTAVMDDASVGVGGGPLRSMSKKRTMVFIVRRSGYYSEFDEESELSIAKYFAEAIISLKRQRPEMRFQYVPVGMGGGARFLKTFLVVAEWDEE